MIDGSSNKHVFVQIRANLDLVLRKIKFSNEH